MNKHIKSIASLTVICALVAVLLAVTNKLTAPIIKSRESSAINDSLSVVLPGGKNFSQTDISDLKLPDTVVEVYKEENGGCVFKLNTSGYASNFVILCGIDKDGVVKGATCISSGETLGAEKEYGEKLKEKTVENISDVETVSGATKTTLAYKSAVVDALNAFIIINGGSVDLRDENQILNDNLSAVLPASDGKFTKVFITEKLKYAENVYKADNDSGYVFEINGTYVAVDNNGNVLVDNEEDLKNKIESDAKSVINSKLTEIDISKYGDMPSHIQKAYKTNNGNYVFELKAAGFGINGDRYYNPSGEYISIKVSATSKGEIISCQTVSQKETDGVGSVCADESFYSQFNGKTESNYSDIDAISGATITTNGYKTAVSKVFVAIKILEGVS